MNVTDRKNDGDYDEALYDEMLNEIYGVINVGVTLQAAEVLSECDPTAYRCGFTDWVDSLGDDFDGGRYECGVCGDRYKYHDDAEECCKEAEK